MVSEAGAVPETKKTAAPRKWDDTTEPMGIGEEAHRRRPEGRCEHGFLFGEARARERSSLQIFEGAASAVGVGFVFFLEGVAPSAPWG